MASLKLFISLLLFVPTNWALSMTSSDSPSVSSMSPPLSKGNSLNTKESAAATLGDLYRKSRQSRCARCYDDSGRYSDRYSEDYERTRYNPSSGRGGGGSPGGGYPSRAYDDRSSGNWYYPRETYDRYDDSRVRYGGDRDNDRYYYPLHGYYYDRNDDRYNTRSYDRYDSRDRYESRYPPSDRYPSDRYPSERSPSETRGYGYGYGSENRDRYYPNDRSNDYYRGGERYPDRNRGSSGGSIYDRYGSDDRYYSRYDYRNYRPWDETYSRGQSGFDNSGRGYYFANDRPNDYYEPPPPYHSQSRPLGPPGPAGPGPTYLPRDPHDQSRPSNSHGYSDSRPGPPSSSSSSSSSPSSSSSSSSPSSASGSDYGNRPRDDVHGHGSGSNDGGGGGGGGGGGLGANRGTTGSSDNKNGYTGGSWSYVNDREKDASYKGGIRDNDNQSSSYGGGRGRPLSGSYLLDRDNNVPEASMVSNQDKPGSDSSQINDSPTASKLTSSPSSSTSNNEDRVTESKASN